MIARLWHGWTEADKADLYEQLLKTEIFPGILAKNVSGFRRIELLRSSLGEEVEFITIMHFDTLDAVIEFAGEDFEAAYVPTPARQLLSRFDARSRHYEVIAERVAR